MMKVYGSLSIAVAILLLGGLYVVFKSSAADRGTGQPLSGTYRLSIKDQRPDANPTVFKMSQGDSVTLLISTDRPGWVNVHGYENGYEKGIVLKLDREATLTVTADRTGRYPIHLHGADGSHLEVAALEVHPR